MVTEATYLNKINTIYDKPTANIILNGRKMKAFPLQSGMRQGCPFLKLLLNIILEVLVIEIRPRKERKGNKIGKEKWVSLFADDMILPMGKQEDVTKKLLDLISEFGKVAGYNAYI